ncbi:MAG: amino acid ABC transporter substrate-binding protein, partial [Burkholderiales bacterium]
IDAAPFSSTDANKQPQGYSVDICREVVSGIQKQLGLSKLDVRWVGLTVQNRLEAVRTGRVDVECSTTSWTLRRQQDVDFSLITFVDGASIITRGASDIFRFADFAGKRIAVIPGTTTIDVLREALRSRSMSSSVVPVSNRADGLRLLQQGEVDGFASDRIVLIALVVNDPGTDAFKVLDDDFSLEQYALALPRGDHDFRLAVNRVLARLYRTGDIMKIYNQWLGNMGAPSVLLYAAYFLQSLAE